jgi:hypothetical protein
MTYNVTAADVASGLRLLVRLGVFSGNTVSRPFGVLADFTNCRSAPPSPSICPHPP